jgi:mannose-6-phosphate isomerase-like protein (cupin superfamily)
MVAPDGADIRLLLELEGGGAALFELASGEISIPVAHHTVEEIWYIIGRRGERI